MACAVCKDSFIVGTVVNRLPCFHRFHPSCILPWLSTRNTCPLCRHEVPTDDVDYEARKSNRGGGYETRPHDVDYEYDNVVDEPSRFERDREQGEVLANEDSAGNNGVRRNRWLFLAAPIVGIVGITLMFCFGNPLRDRKFRSGRVSHRRENSSSQRRWWSFF
ncbi:E3 ubiquitin-protein ligase ring1 [Phtheirospermum japonicum]|uniref:E3 ubiquitin-protein ligase ring1 n=1 Tax=Phtheirospermum japonicum TaxID=374723 RepID=A0A830C0Z1_9LAMI|nr:E3 ubiquitin-protein ligase ring1 [Phtheirospermum japonicum]